MIIKNVRFVKSAVKPSHYPEYDLPEIAFAGRSNVGKSSLINSLIQRRDMVKTSSKPGCTQLINFFVINETLSFVDLPGYGFAKVSKKIRSQWQPMVNRYLSCRANLFGLILLIDIRRDPGKEEFDMIEWLESRQIPYLIVLTKADKLSKTNQAKQRTSICRQIGLDTDDAILFSARTKQGRDIVLDEIQALTAAGEDEQNDPEQ
jgi:GTP-binding protein